MLVAIETGVAAAALLLEQGNLLKGIDNKTVRIGLNRTSRPVRKSGKF